MAKYHDKMAKEAKIRRKTVVTLRRERYKYREIGEMLGVSTARAQQLYQEAVSRGESEE